MSRGSLPGELLATGIALDLHPNAFQLDSFALTGLHHTPILIHRSGDNRYDLYVMLNFRTLGLGVAHRRGVTVRVRDRSTPMKPLLVVVMGLGTTVAQAAESGLAPADYAAATAVLEHNLQGLVRNESVEPHWLGTRAGSGTAVMGARVPSLSW